MQLIQDIPVLYSPNYDLLYRKLQGIDFQKVFYEVDLINGNINNFDVITWNKDTDIWTEYDKANFYNQATWLSRDEITLPNIKMLGFSNVLYHKATYIGEQINGAITHVGQFLNRPNKEFKAVYEIPSLKRTLNTLEYPNKEKILHTVRDSLERPKIQVSITIPRGNYDIQDLGIECAYPGYPIETILCILKKNNLITLENFNNLFNFEDAKEFMVSHFKLVYHKGNLQTCKLYLFIK